MKQFFQILVVGYDAADGRLVVVRKNEERPGGKAGRNGHAEFAPTIVMEYLDPFKPQIFQQTGRIVLKG